MHKFLIRAASGIIYAAVIVAAILGGQWSIYALALVFSSIGVCELLHMSIGYSRRTLPIYIIQVLQVILFVTVIGLSLQLPVEWIGTLTIVFVLLLIPYYFFSRRILDVNLKEFLNSSMLKPIGYGVGYLGIPLALMVLCPLPRLALLVFVLLWINDSGAYIVGSLTGRHKLSPSISPNKTWEGFIGSALSGVPAADLFIANINRNIITADLPRYVEAMKPGAEMLLSGFYESDIPEVMKVAEPLGLKYEGHTVETGDWTCLKLKYDPS